MSKKKRVVLDSRQYRAAHKGNEPRGVGPWLFRVTWRRENRIMLRDLRVMSGRHTLVRRELRKQVQDRVPLASEISIETMPSATEFLLRMNEGKAERSKVVAKFLSRINEEEQDRQDVYVK